MDNEVFQKRVFQLFDRLTAEGKKTCKEIAEINTAVAGLKTDFMNHLKSIDKKSKSKKEKIQYLITGVSLFIAIITVMFNTLSI